MVVNQVCDTIEYDVVQHTCLVGNIGKLDSRTEVCLFIGYPKGTRGGIFYNIKNKKVFMSTHATFLEHEYINDFKPRSKVLLEDVLENKSQD